MRSVLLFWVFAWMPLVAESNEQTTPENTLNCLKDLELPRFAVAQVVPKGGTVRAVVLLGDDGEPNAIKIEGTDWHLSAEVEHHLRKAALYRKGCGGQAVALEFTFKVEGEAVPSPFAKVRFLPPNHFIITTQPAQSTPDFVPTPNQKKRDARRHGKQ